MPGQHIKASLRCMSLPPKAWHRPGIERLAHMRAWFTPRIVLPTSVFSSTMSSRAAQHTQQAQQARQNQSMAGGRSATGRGLQKDAATRRHMTWTGLPWWLTSAWRHAALGLVVVAVGEPGVIDCGDGPRLLPACRREASRAGARKGKLSARAAIYCSTVPPSCQMQPRMPRRWPTTEARLLTRDVQVRHAPLPLCPTG